MTDDRNRPVFFARTSILSLPVRIYHIRRDPRNRTYSACGAELRHLLQSTEAKAKGRGLKLCARCRKVVRDDELQTQYQAAPKVGDERVRRPAPLFLFAAFGAMLALAVVGTSAVARQAPEPTGPPPTALDEANVRLVYWRGRARANWRLYRRASRQLRAAQREARRLRARFRIRHTVGAEPSGAFSVSQASWYGPGFYGHRTACGLTLTTGSSWVAHKTLACGTRLLICAARCSRTFVGDRGPYVAGRDFDLAPGLKAAIGFGSTGPVRWRLL